MRNEVNSFPMPEIQMPKLSDTMTEGTLVAWKKKKGDKVSAGDVIAEIETDKATMEWESPEDGTLTEIYVEEGGKVDVGQRIAFIGEEGEAAPKEEKKAPEKEEKKKSRQRKKQRNPKNQKRNRPKRKSLHRLKQKKRRLRRRRRQRSGACRPHQSLARRSRPERPARPPLKNAEARVKASPVARRIAAELGVDLAQRERNRPGRPRNRKRCARCRKICSRGR